MPRYIEVWDLTGTTSSSGEDEDEYLEPFDPTRPRTTPNVNPNTSSSRIPNNLRSPTPSRSEVGSSSRSSRSARSQGKDPQKAMDYALSLETTDLSFVLTMHKSFVTGDCRLTLPLAHCEDVDLGRYKDEYITLMHMLQTYQVKIKYSRGHYRIGEGWRNFVMQAGVEIHDALHFERLSDFEGHLVYRVTLVKA